MPEVAQPRYDPEEGRALRRGPPPPPPEPGAVRVGFLAPLSGPLAKIGQAMLQAAEMAVFDLAGPNFELLPYDTGGRPEQAERAAKMAMADACTLFLGPLLSADVLAASPIAAPARIAVIAFSSDRKIASDNVFVLGFTPETEVERIVRFASQQGRNHLAVLAPDDAYGAAVMRVAKAVAEASAVTVVAMETYPTTTTDFAETVRKLPGVHPQAPAAASGILPASGGATPTNPNAGMLMTPQAVAPVPPSFDALLIADGGDRLKAIAAQLPAHGIAPDQMQILGTGAWDEPGLGSEPGLVGAWYAAPDPAFRRDFERTYQALFGSRPHRLATIAYDATAMAALLARDRPQSAYQRAAISDPSGFLGRDGLFRFNGDGTVDRRLAVLRVDRDSVTVISAAEESFAGM